MARSATRMRRCTTAGSGPTSPITSTGASAPSASRSTVAGPEPRNSTSSFAITIEALHGNTRGGTVTTPPSAGSASIAA
jgi:hypothetical protein